MMYSRFEFNGYLFMIAILLTLGCSSEQTTATTTTAPTEVEKSQASEDKKVILFFGNSLTAAYGLDIEDGFTSLIQEKIDASGKAYKVVNAGLSGETSAGGLSRIDWILERQQVDIFVLELGGNDGLRGLDPGNTFENLKKIAEKVLQKFPDCQLVLAGMQAPPNMGQQYTSEFKSMYPRLAKELDMELIPFLLEGVAGDKSLNQKDGIHPTAEGQIILTKNIWEILGPML